MVGRGLEDWRESVGDVWERRLLLVMAGVLMAGMTNDCGRSSSEAAAWGKVAHVGYRTIAT